jgi:hypothetical protein
VDLSFVQRPTAVVHPESAEVSWQLSDSPPDAADTQAAGRGLRVAPQGTGHSGEPMGVKVSTRWTCSWKAKHVRRELLFAHS